MHPNSATPDPAIVSDPLPTEIGHHLADLGRHLDVYLDAVARELRALGVVTDPPRRTDPSGRLIGSIVIDCAALPVVAGPSIHGQGGGEQPVLTDLSTRASTPVVVTWDEVTGWCAGLHDDAASSSRRYLELGLLPPAAVVAEFVVDLAQGRPVGTARPLGGEVPTPARRKLRVV